jgi:hypothetical protein
LLIAPFAIFQIYLQIKDRINKYHPTRVHSIVQQKETQMILLDRVLELGATIYKVTNGTRSHTTLIFIERMIVIKIII